MTIYKKYLILLLLITLFPIVGFSQQDIDTAFEKDTSYAFQNDTLYLSTGFKIYLGQKLTVGKGSNENGQFETISFKSALAFPLLFLRETEIKNNTDYQRDPTERDRDIVKEHLQEGQSLIVKKVKEYGKRKNKQYYILQLWDGDSKWANKYFCDIILAIKLKEILIR
jgi:hypothetical protein